MCAPGTQPRGRLRSRADPEASAPHVPADSGAARHMSQALGPHLAAPAVHNENPAQPHEKLAWRRQEPARSGLGAISLRLSAVRRGRCTQVKPVSLISKANAKE